MAFEMGEEEKYQINQISRVLNEYLMEISDRECFVFVCRYYYSDSVESIAKMLGISSNTVFRDLAKTRKGLKTALEKEGYLYE